MIKQLESNAVAYECILWSKYSSMTEYEFQMCNVGSWASEIFNQYQSSTGIEPEEEKVT